MVALAQGDEAPAGQRSLGPAAIEDLHGRCWIASPSVPLLSPRRGPSCPAAIPDRSATGPPCPTTILDRKAALVVAVVAVAVGVAAVVAAVHDV